MSAAIRRVLVLTVHAHPSHYERDIPLVLELRRRGYQATYAVPGPRFTKRQFPGTNFPAAVLERPAFRDAGTVVLSSLSDYRRVLRQHDLLLLQITRERSFERIAAELNKYRIIHQNTGGADLPSEDPDFMAVSGEWHRRRVLARGFANPERVVVTGSVQFDRVFAPEVVSSTREGFCGKYGLDPAKPIVVWLPESPATHSPWYQDLYRRVCDTVRASGRCNLIIKGHPSDYAGHKRAETYRDTSRPSWEQLAPEVPACEEADGYICFKHCDLGITVSSTVFMDFALFRKPILYLDFQEGCLPNGTETAVPLPAKRFQGFGYHRLDLLPDVIKRIRQGGTSRGDCYVDVSGPENLDQAFYYVGAECSMAELPQILQRDSFQVEDQSLYDKVVRLFCHANDGQSVKRIIDLVDRLRAEDRPPFITERSRVNPARRVYRRIREVLHGV